MKVINRQIRSQTSIAVIELEIGDEDLEERLLFSGLVLAMIAYYC